MSPVLELPKRRLLLAYLDTTQRINYCHHKPPIIFPSGGEEAARKGVEGSDLKLLYLLMRVGEVKTLMKHVAKTYMHCQNCRTVTTAETTAKKMAAASLGS